MRTLLWMMVGLVTALVLDGLTARAGHGARWMDPYLILVVVFASRGGKARAMIGGGAAGFLQDLVASAVFGVHYLGKLVVGYAASLVASRLIPGQALTAAVLLGGATLLEKLVFSVAGLVLGTDFAVGTPIEIGVQVLVNIGVGMLAFRAVDRFARRRPGPGGARGR